MYILRYSESESNMSCITQMVYIFIYKVMDIPCIIIRIVAHAKLLFTLVIDNVGARHTQNKLVARLC